MEAKIKFQLNSYTASIPTTIIEGIIFREGDFEKPNAHNSNWVLEVKINISEDKIIDLTCLAIGRSLHKAEPIITINYNNREKKVAVNNDEFSARKGLVLINEKIEL